MPVLSVFALILSMSAADSTRLQAAELLEHGLSGAEGAATPERRRALLVEAGREAARTLKPARTADLLQTAVEDACWGFALGDERADERAQARLAQALAGLAADLRFQPRIEAELPVGFPLPTAVHEIELKRYPGYRMASASSSGRNAFWTLFQHIEKHEIAMTAPVEMTYRADGEVLRETHMAFLYGESAIGSLGTDERVNVIDVPAMEVVSLGCRGNSTDARIAEGRALLAAWLAEHPQLEAAGELRAFGYNSPMVRGNRRTFEVQIPVRRVSAEARATSTP